MSTIFDNFNGTVDLKVFKKNNPDPKTSLRRHYLSLVGLLQYVDIMNGDAEGSLPAGWNENTIAGMLNHCIGDLDTRMAAISPSPVPVETPDWFWCENLYDGENILQITANEGADYEYSFDGIEWLQYDGENDPEFTDKIYVRALPQSGVHIDCKFEFGVGGNAMSLLYGSEFTGEEIEFPENGTFNGIFTDSKLNDASNLVLPALVLTKGCYANMFNHCSALTGVPELPAKSFAPGCYSGMFGSCKISEVKIYIEGEWDSTCTDKWLGENSMEGVLYNFGGATGIPTNDASGCPSGWTIYPNPNTVPGEEPSNPIDVTGTELEQMLTPSNEPNSEPIQEEEDEEEEGTGGVLTSGSNSPLVAQIGYFYNVTSPSTRFAKGVYTIISETSAVPFTAAITGKELEKLVNEQGLISDTTYYIIDAKENPVCYAISTNAATEIYQQPTGWTPENPIEVTEKEFADLMGGGYLNTGYFYNVTSDEVSPTYEGLYVVDTEFLSRPFDKNNIVTSAKFDGMIEHETLVDKTIYYISDMESGKDTRAVRLGTGSNKYDIINRSRSPKPIPEPGPEPEPKGWRFDDPIVCDGKDLNGNIAGSTLYPYYFYYAASTFEQITAETTYLATSKNYVVEFDKNNAQLDENIQKMAQLETLKPNDYYFATDTEVLYLATSKNVLKSIERTPISGK